MTNKTTNKGIPDFSPGDIADDTSRTHFERGAGRTIERNRWFLMSIIQGLALIGCAIGFNFLIPLKSVETFQVNKVEGGRLVVDGAPVGYWNPDSDSIAYFISKWANSVFDINQSTIEQTIAESGEMAIGNATKQLQELRNKNNPFSLLRESPGLVRTYEYKTINFIKDDVALLRFKTTTRFLDRVTETTYAMTVTFVRIKPVTRQQVMRNPAGLFISNFNVTEESVSK